MVLSTFNRTKYKNRRGILSWLICIAYVGLFFPIQVSNIAYILLFGYCLFNIQLREIITTFRRNLFAKLLTGMYLMQIVGLLYTTNYKTGFFILEKKIYFLLFPILCLPVFQKFEDRTILKKIGVITISSSLILLCVALYRMIVLNDPHAFYFESFNEFEGFTPIHYVYYSLYFCCGSIFLIDSLFDLMIQKKWSLIMLAILYVYSFGIIVLVASKIGIIVFVLAAAVFLFIKLKKRKLFLVAITALILIAALALSINTTTQNRFRGLNEHLSMVTEDEPIKDANFSGLNMRLLFWRLQLKNAAHDGLLLFGVGTGDTQDYIDSIYKLPKYNYQLYGYIGWDSHNQWVYTLLELGLAGVALMGYLFLVYLRKALTQHNLSFICFLIITLAFSFTESILESNKGIVFFSLFFTILSVSNCGKKDASLLENEKKNNDG
jgi:O-antigen ligase